MNRVEQLRLEIERKNELAKKRARIKEIIEKEKLSILREKLQSLASLLKRAKELLLKAKDRCAVTRSMTSEDFELWIDDVQLSRNEHIDSLINQFIGLLKRREDIERYESGRYKQKCLSINELALDSVVKDIELYENDDGYIEFPY